MRIMYPLLVAVLLAACSTATTHVINPINVAQSPTFTLKIYHDTENLSENISNRIRNLGFKPSANDGSATRYAVFVDYKTYWDVAYQTFEHFVITFKDAKTNETLITSNYVGRVGFNSCNAAMDIVFRDLAAKIQK